MGRPRRGAAGTTATAVLQDMSTLVTHTSQALPRNQQSPQGAANAAVAAAAITMGGGRGHAPPTTMFIQNMSQNVGVTNMGVANVIGSLGGNLYMTSEQQRMIQATPTTATKPVGVAQALPTKEVHQKVVLRNEGTSGGQNRNPAHQPNALGHASAVAPETRPRTTLGTTGMFIPPPAASATVATPPHVKQEPGSHAQQATGSVLQQEVAPPRKRRRRRRKSPTAASSARLPSGSAPPPLKRPRGRPKGSGIGVVGRRGRQRSRVLSQTRYANILPRPSIVGKGSPVMQGLHTAAAAQQGGGGGLQTGASAAVMGSSSQMVPGGVGGTVPGVGASVGHVVTLNSGEVQSSLPGPSSGSGLPGGGVANGEGVVRNKEVAVAAANCSAALSFGTRKVSPPCIVNKVLSCPL